ncbi:hypothetical protein Tco_0603165, partial [Tanacetum coccineum]
MMNGSIIEDNGVDVVIPQNSSKEIPNAKNTLDGIALDPWIPALEQGGAHTMGEKERKALKLALKLIKERNNRKRKAYGRKRAIAYMKLCKTQSEDNVQASPNYKAKIKTQTSSTAVFIFATFHNLARGNKYFEKDKDKAKTGQNQAREWKEREKTKAEGIPIFYGPTQAQLMGQ